MFEYINLILGGLRETKSKMWESRSKVDFMTNSDQFLESLSHHQVHRYVGNRNGLNCYVTCVIERDRQSPLPIQIDKNRRVLYIYNFVKQKICFQWSVPFPFKRPQHLRFLRGSVQTIFKKYYEKQKSNNLEIFKYILKLI